MKLGKTKGHVNLNKRNKKEAPLQKDPRKSDSEPHSQALVARSHGFL